MLRQLTNDPDQVEELAQEAFVALAEASGLKRGMQVLETACGVGGAARYLARDFDVEVVATNLSEGQLTIARQRTATDGLGDKVRFEYADFTELPEAVHVKGYVRAYAEFLGLDPTAVLEDFLEEYKTTLRRASSQSVGSAPSCCFSVNECQCPMTPFERR